MRKCNLVESKCKGCLLFSVQQILTSLKVKFWADSMNRLVKKFTAVPGEVKGVNEWQVPWVELAIMSSSKMTALVGELYKVTTHFKLYTARLESETGIRHEKSVPYCPKIKRSSREVQSDSVWSSQKLIARKKVTITPMGGSRSLCGLHIEPNSIQHWKSYTIPNMKWRIDQVKTGSKRTWTK